MHLKCINVVILSVSGGDFDFVMTDEGKKNLSPGDTQQPLKITPVCPTEGWGMKVAREWREKKREKAGKRVRTRAGNRGKEGRKGSACSCHQPQLNKSNQNVCSH